MFEILRRFLFYFFYKSSLFSKHILGLALFEIQIVIDIIAIYAESCGFSVTAFRNIDPNATKPNYQCKKIKTK